MFYKGAPLTDREVRHETVHLWQQALLLVVPFYVLYLLFWLIGLVRYGKQYHAYRSIPFERSAYQLETFPKARWHTKAFNWIKHLTK